MRQSIKTLAKEAKQRMCEGQNPENRGILPDHAAEEERVYRQVCRLMAEPQFVPDPIAQVAESDKWRRLTGIERERYVLQLAEIYRKMCARYLSEQGKGNR